MRSILVYRRDSAIFISLIAVQDLHIAILNGADSRVLVLTLIAGISLRLLLRFIFFLLVLKPVTNFGRTIFCGGAPGFIVSFGALVQLVRRRFAAHHLDRLLLDQFGPFFLRVGRNR